MPISIQDMQQIATRADLVQLRQEIAAMMEAVKSSILKETGKSNKGNPLERQFYSPTEFSQLVGVSRQTVVRWAQEGVIKALQKGGKGCVWLVPHSELERLVEESDDLEPEIR